MTQRNKLVANRVLRNVLRYAFFVGPAGAIYAVFVLKPLIGTIWLSLYEWNGAGPKVFLGLANYAELARDQVFWIALRNNLIWILASVINPMLIGLVIAAVLANLRRGRIIYQTVFFSPVVLNLVVVGIVWGLMYNPILGVINSTLRFVGLESWTRGWLGDPFWTVPSIILAGNWTFFGFCMVIFLAGMQSISKDIYEAAMLDGASAFTQFTKITIPELSNHINLLVVYSIIGSFKVFDITYVMTKGGPNHASEVMATYLYWQVFTNGRVGYGTAIATMLTLIVLTLSLLFLSKREVSG